MSQGMQQKTHKKITFQFGRFIANNKVMNDN